MRISDWSSDVCSSDLRVAGEREPAQRHPVARGELTDEPAPARGDQHRRDGAEGKIAPDRELKRSEAAHQFGGEEKNGRASCRERVCQSVETAVVAVALKK